MDRLNLDKNAENLESKKDKVIVITSTLSKLGYDVVGGNASRDVHVIDKFIDSVKRREEGRQMALERKRREGRESMESMTVGEDNDTNLDNNSDFLLGSKMNAEDVVEHPTNFKLPRRRTENLTGDVDDWIRLLDDRKLGGKKTSKVRKLSNEEKNAGMNQLAQLVASKLRFDISRNKKMANVSSANAYIKSRQDKVAGKSQKDGVTPKRSGFEGWIASNEFDIDDDGRNDNIVYEGVTEAGKPKNIKYVEGYNVGARNEGAYRPLQDYMTNNSPAAQRKTPPYSFYISGLRKTEDVETIMDLWKDIFGDYLANDEKYNGAESLNKSSKMIQNRVRTYLYRMFMIYLCRAVGVINQDDSLALAIEKIKRVSKSAKARDTILNKVYTEFANESNKQSFEDTLFGIINEKVEPLVALLIEEYQKGIKIPPEAVTELLFG
jgi:hypothetical protein